MPTVFKKCPNCGKRFEVEHTGESVEKKTEVVTEEKPISPASLMALASQPPDNPVELPPVARVAEEVEEDDYTETYRCKHCGHVWTEKHALVRDLGEVKGAGLDRRS